MEGEKINMSSETKRCSVCGKLHSASSIYFNRKEGNLCCINCLTIEKKKREKEEIKEILKKKKLERLKKKGKEFEKGVNLNQKR